ncbi:MAG: hypothetical protein MSC30_13245 [Gaiellaceae bacterium MAG52_C11]|nr:hypothetical protein [Candidatus Gaiellasilicea maunaloa]
MTRLLALGLLGLVVAVAVGLGIHALTRETIALPVVKLEQGTSLAPPAARARNTPPRTTGAATTSATTTTTGSTTTGSTAEDDSDSDSGRGRGRGRGRGGGDD